MRLVSPRLLLLGAVLVVGWAGVHLLGARSFPISPAVWPGAAPAVTTGPSPGALPVAPALGSPAAGAATVPILPGALRQLNGSTRDTAIGLYALIQQLEGALSSRLEQIQHQLEPGR